ncbi:MAG TPA: universal stress protein [Nitrososphaeraceae archaeon]|nr:universal stress protein [Nitrososphaeraceae archaeon]
MESNYSYNNQDKFTLETNSRSTDHTSSISKENIPSFRKILVADQGKKESNDMLNYAVSLSNYSGAELLILRVLENIKNTGDVSVEGRIIQNEIQNKDLKQDVKGQIIEAMEEKIEKCREAGCKNKISYKFRTGDTTDETVKEIKEGSYDLVLLKRNNVGSWIKSFGSDTRKILGNITIPALLVR